MPTGAIKLAVIMSAETGIIRDKHYTKSEEYMKTSNAKNKQHQGLLYSGR